MASESGYAFTGLAQPPSGELLLEYVRKKDVTKAMSAVVLEMQHCTLLSWYWDSVDIAGATGLDLLTLSSQ